MTIKQWNWFYKPYRRKKTSNFFHLKIEVHFQIVYEENSKRRKLLLPEEVQDTLCGLTTRATMPHYTPVAYTGLDLAYLPSAASSTPDIHWWHAWWIHPIQSHSDRCTLHHPWSWLFGLEGHWWLYTGLAFALGAEAIWKGRKNNYTTAGEQPMKTCWANFPFSEFPLCQYRGHQCFIWRIYLSHDLHLDCIQKLKDYDAQSLKHHRRFHWLCLT